MKNVSVIIPVYNAVRFLAECVESLLQQSYADFDLCLVDDGSTDGSGALCDVLAGQYSGIKVIHQDNRGVSAARNRGIEETEGVFCCFVDADDRVSPEYLQHLVEACTGEAEMVVGGLCQVGDGKRDTVLPGSRDFVPGPDGTQDMADLFRSCLLFGPVAKLYRRSLLAAFSIRFPEGVSYGEDLVFNMTCLRYIRRLITVDHADYYYRRTEENTLSTRFVPQKFGWNVEQCRLLRDYCREKNLKGKQIDDWLAVRWWGIIYDAVFDVYKFRAFRTFRKRCQAVRSIVSVPEMEVLRAHASLFPCPAWLRFFLFYQWSLGLSLTMELIYLRYKRFFVLI